MGNHNLGDMSSTSRIELFPSDFTLSGGVYGCGEGNTLIQLKTIDDGSAINSQQSYSWAFDSDNNSLESMHSCPGQVIGVKTGGKLSTKAGSSLAVFDQTEKSFSLYQQWTKNYQRLSILSGPYSFVNSNGNIAAAAQNIGCADGMVLKALTDDSASDAQQFYIGNNGVIHSTKCPGLVVTAPPNCAEGEQLSLKTATGDDGAEWNFNSDGSITTARCSGYAVGIDGDSIVLASRDSASNNQKWQKINTRLLSEIDGGWNNNWEIDYVEKYNTPIPSVAVMSVGYDNGLLIHQCYNASDAFSASFEAFSRDMNIDDETDEDQCRNARKLLVRIAWYSSSEDIAN